MKKFVTIALLLAAMLCIVFTVPASAGAADLPASSADRINNIDCVGDRTGLKNGENTVVTILKNSAVGVRYSSCLIRGWSISKEGTAGFRYRLSYVKANGSLDAYDLVEFAPEVRTDVTAANPDYASANPDSKVGINLYLPLAQMKAGTYLVEIFAVTGQGKTYQVLKAYVVLESNYNVNGDDVFDVRDAIAYRKAIADSSFFSAAWDFNKDGVCDEYDYRELLYQLLSRQNAD